MKTYTPEQLLAINKAWTKLDENTRWLKNECDCIACMELHKANYTTSYDAIIPAIVKWIGKDSERAILFADYCPVLEDRLFLTEIEMCIAGLKAAGKLPEGIE